MPTPFTRFLLAASTAIACTIVPSLARADGPETVHFETEGSEVYLRTPQVTNVEVHRGRYGTKTIRSPVYDPLCTEGSCDQAMQAGEYHLGLAQPGGPVVEADDPVEINGNTTVRGEYHDMTAWRALGVVVGLGAAGGGTAMIVVAGNRNDGQPGRVDGPLMIGGLSVLTGGLIASLILVMQHDTASFTIEPLAVGAFSGRRESGVATAMPSGLQLTMRF